MKEVEQEEGKKREIKTKRKMNISEEIYKEGCEGR